MNTTDHMTETDPHGLVDPAHDDRRRHPRRAVVWRGSVSIAGRRLACWVRNVAPGGMLAEIELPLAAGALVTVELPKLRPLPAVIAWSSGVFHGLSFVEPAPQVIQAFGARATALGFTEATDSPRPDAPTPES